MIVRAKHPQRKDNLPLVLAELAAAGVPSQQIALVVALGTHRPLTPAELQTKLGPAADGPFTVVNTPATDSHAFADAGFTASLRPDLGLPPIPAQINRHVLEADLRIGIGMITPHLNQGLAAGPKSCCRACAACARWTPSPGLGLCEGQLLGNPDAPLRCLLERFVAAHTPLHFIVNAILAPDGSLHACVAGDALLAQHTARRKWHGRCTAHPLAAPLPGGGRQLSPYDQIMAEHQGSLCGRPGGRQRRRSLSSSRPRRKATACTRTCPVTPA